jgi:hypothetical protein
MFGIDTNLLVYAHNTDSEFHEDAVTFLEKVMNERDEEGYLSVCVPVQVLMEFIAQGIPLRLGVETVEEAQAEMAAIRHWNTGMTSQGQQCG